MEADLQHDFTGSMEVLFEHDIAFDGFSYLVIFGKHINGGFIAIPNWNICCEASALPDNAAYNTEKLVRAGMKKKTARAIADYISGAMELKEAMEEMAI